MMLNCNILFHAEKVFNEKHVILLDRMFKDKISEKTK